MQVAKDSNPGMERSRNEDSYYAEMDTRNALLVVADGMGGHQAGNVASAMAIKVAENYWQDISSNSSISAENARQLLKDMILDANQQIISEAAGTSTLRGMGTTLTAGLLRGSHLTIGHVGDSRAYRIHNDSIELLTRDHSLLEQLIEAGEIRPEKAKNHPQRHILTRAVGIDNRLEVDIYEKEIESGSVLLFCTDGLTNQVNDDEIKNICLEDQNPQKMVSALIKKANDRGGHDNITVVVATGIGGHQD